MRALILAPVVVAMLAGPAVAQPTVKQLLRADRVADGACRGGDPNSTERSLECERRSRIFGRLSQLGYCYGKKGEVGADMNWHRCTPQSLVVNDLKPGIQN